MDKGSGMNAGRNGPSSIDVLIETLVYLLSWPIAFVRNVVEQVFTNFADRVSVSSLQILIDVSLQAIYILHARSNTHTWSDEKGRI